MKTEQLYIQLINEYNKNSFEFCSLTIFLENRFEDAINKKRYNLANKLQNVINLCNNDFNN